MVGFLIQNLPIIISLGSQLISRMQSLIGVLSSWFQNLQATIGGFGNLLRGVFSNVSRFDFTDQSGEISRSMTQIERGIQGMEDGFDEAINLLKQPFDFSMPEQEQDQRGDQPSDPGTSDGSQSTVTYTSEGGETITDPGGADYGEYRPGAEGSRGKARVHGSDGKKRGHTGEDYAMPTGTPLTMLAPGTVYDVEHSIAKSGGYGKFIVIQLDSGEFVRLAHLDKIYVKKGEKVGANTGPNGTAKVVGLSGNTGLSGGPHLHLDYAKAYDPATAAVSNTMNPMSFIKARGLVKGTNVKATGETRTQTPSAPPPKSGSEAGTSGGSVSPQTVYSYLKSKGLGHNHIMGIIAGIDGESSFQIGIQEKGNSKQGVGLFQYTSPDRKGPFLKTVPNYKTNWKGQVDYAIDIDPNTAIYLSRQFSTPEAAAEWWLINWERPREDLRPTRRTKYKQFIASFKKPGQQGTSQAKVSSSPRSNTSQQITQERQPQQFFVPMPPNQSTPQPPPRPPGGGGVSSGDEGQGNILDHIRNFLLTR